MTPKRVIVIGASAGGLEALRVLVAGLPGDFSVPICIALHISPESPGAIPDILGRSGRLPASLPHDLQRIKSGHIYVAPPDRHLLVEPGQLRVTKGPREHGFRPAIDPLFRSAAQVFGPAAIGIVLTGNLDDGTAGLWTIKKLGGTAIVQDPSEAVFPSMPEHALKHVNVDYVVPLAAMPSLIAALTKQASTEVAPDRVPAQVEMEVNIAKEEHPRDAGLEHIGTPSPYACPDCHGVLLELEEGDRKRFRCHIGHAYSIDRLLAAMDEGIERAMSAAQRALEEGSLLMKRMALQLAQQDHREASSRLMEASIQAKRKAEMMQDLIHNREAVPTADPVTGS